MRQQRIRQPAPFHLVIGQRLAQIIVQRTQCAIAIDLGEFAVGIDHLAIADHAVHTTRLRALQHSVEKWCFRIEIRIAHLPPVDQHHVGRAPRLEHAETLTERRGLGTTRRRHAEHLRRRRYIVVHARHPVRAQHHAHLLQHVAIVVDARLVEADRGIDPLRLEHVQRRHARAQAEVRRAVVADAGAGRRQSVDVGLVQPHAMAQCHLRSEQPEPVDVIHGRAAAATMRVFLLVSRLHQMHVQRHVVFARGLRQTRECRV